MITFHAVDEYLDRMFNLARRVHAVLTEADVEYRIVGGVAVFLHINELDPLAARLTPDVDLAIDRKDLETVAVIAGKHGFRYADGTWTADQPRSVVHFLFVGEKLGRITWRTFRIFQRQLSQKIAFCSRPSTSSFV
jgi:hypothetical protein